jgi:uncharacterized protein (DUF488 family)
MRTPSPLLTVGHGTCSAEELAALVREAGIASLVDVRRFPGSRRHPQFAREALQDWMPRLAGARYRWEAELGGFRRAAATSPNVALRNPSFRAYADYMQTEPFAATLDALLHGAADEPTAVMCSETLWWRCHRRLIADAAALLHGVPVLHLAHDGRLHPHVPTAGVRRADGILCYDVLPLFAGSPDAGSPEEGPPG